MSFNNINITKGFDLNLAGKAVLDCETLDRAPVYTINISDFQGIVPKLLSKEGDIVKVGTPIFCSKEDSRIQFTAPVSGSIASIVRGEKRKILSIEIKPDPTDQFESFELPMEDPEAIKTLLLQSGCWPFIKQRPYNIIANPDRLPKAIFVSLCPTAPLSPELSYSLSDDLELLQKGIDTISKLTAAPIHVAIKKDSHHKIFANLQGVTIHEVSGPHPAGNVSVQIQHISPLNAGEVVWTILPEHLVIIGRLFATQQFNPIHTIAVVGAVSEPKYYKTPMGTPVKHLLSGMPEQVRLVSGDLLTGTKITADQPISMYERMLSVVSENSEIDVLPYMPLVKNNKIPSIGRVSLYRYFFKNKVYKPNTKQYGEHRAFVMTGEMEQVFPFDIYPMYLLKAILAQDIEKMEALGIYEVVPEDFGLIDYISSSKIEAQEIVRKGIELMIREVG